MEENNEKGVVEQPVLIENKTSFNLVLLWIIAIACVVIAVTSIKKLSSSSNGEQRIGEQRVLVAIISDETKSDETQIKNALANGGQCYFSSEDHEYLRIDGKSYSDYAASSDDRTYYIYGAILNFIASRGWTLVSVGGGSTFYFTKEVII